MKDSMKITIKYQFMYMLLMQLAASGIAFVFGMIAFWYFTNINIAKQILSLAFIAVNFAMLYTASKKFALLDNKSYTPLKASKIKGLLFGCFISAVNVLLILVFRLLWAKYGSETGINGILPTIYNAIFFFWTYPYNGIMNLDFGTFTWYSALAMVIMPVLAAFIGYIAGSKKFEFTEKIDEFMYEKEE